MEAGLWVEVKKRLLFYFELLNHNIILKQQKFVIFFVFKHSCHQ